MFEHLFEHGVVSQAAVIEDLRAKIAQVQQAAPEARSQQLPTHESLSGLLQLRAGACYRVESMTLAMLLMAGPSAAGLWSAVVGLPDFGAEAAAGYGVDLSRMLVIDDAGEDPMGVLAVLSEAVGVIVTAGLATTARAAERIRARLRRSGGILIVAGQWPQADADVGLSDVRWLGLGSGHGNVRARQATLTCRLKTGQPRRARLWLPDEDQRVRPVIQTIGQGSRS